MWISEIFKNKVVKLKLYLVFEAMILDFIIV